MGAACLLAVAAAAQSACPLPPSLPCSESTRAVEPTQATIEAGERLLRAERWAESIRALRNGLPGAEQLADYGLRVRFHAALGQALWHAGDEAAARAHLEEAVRAWRDESTLGWIRSVPSSAASDREVLRAAEAAGTARLTLADIAVRQVLVPLPRFALEQATLPFGERRDSDLSAAELRVRTAFRKRYERAFISYLRGAFLRWLVMQNDALRIAEAEYEQVFLMPPVLAPRLRVAVYARIGALWWDYASKLRGSEREERILYGDRGRPFFSCFESPGDTEKTRARAAFEKCVSTSKNHRVFSRDTVFCEEWLGTHYRAEFARPDELSPYADMSAPPAWLRALPPIAVGDR